ncbi:MAG: NADH-quinone oxidoreductase subunit D [Phycisphaerales bacterium]|jgi:NADH-quinone oxidoreductase subunit D|nr:NADH-quinone oxidoreductase subunit D [Phycisphaerales bacterium]
MPYTIAPADPELLPPDQQGGESSNRWTLNFGPQHPATHTTLRLVLELDGERILRCTPHIGYLHSGFEKLGEHLNYNQYVTIVDRMDYSAPIYNELAWHGATEKLMGIELTPRCKVLRTIAGELGRIQSHLLCIGAAGLDLGAFTAFLYGFNEREVIYDIVEYMSGQRFHTSWTRVGGLNMDLPDENVFKEMVKKFINGPLPKAADDVEALLTKNRIFIDRTQGVGTLTKEEATAWSLTGPLARASGVRRDIRKDEPYLCFQDNWDGQGAPAVDFKVPIMNTGDVYARYLVRLEELRQSIKIINQLIDNIPQGPVNVSPEGKDVLPPKDQVYSSIEGLIQHFELIMTNRGFTAPKGEVYGCIESGNGELGYYIVSDGGNVPWRARTRPCSYINYQSFPKQIEGHMISDVVAVLGSINVIAAELDR